MAPRYQSILKLTIFFGLFVLLVSQCNPEKQVSPSTKVIPLEWIDEDQLITRVDSSYAIRNRDGTVTPLRFADLPRKSPSHLNFDLTPPSGDQIKIGNYISVGDESLQTRAPNLQRRQYAMNQHFEPGEYLNVLTYLLNGEIGLIVFDQTGARKIALPLLDKQNRSAPIVVHDKRSGNFFAFQSGCSPDDTPGSCSRSAWWLDSDLRVTSNFLLPKKDPLHIGEQLACFSCGCGCYTQEDVYAVNGTAYFQYSGFPLPTSQRGLYMLVAESDGSTKWKQVISGRIEPPLAFSPSGCKVAYFQVSWLGDSLKTTNICQ